MYMLINYIYMFQVVYKGFKCRLKFVQSALIPKEFCMQKNKVKTFFCCCFSASHIILYQLHEADHSITLSHRNVVCVLASETDYSPFGCWTRYRHTVWKTLGQLCEGEGECWRGGGIQEPRGVTVVGLASRGPRLSNMIHSHHPGKWFAMY